MTYRNSRFVIGAHILAIILAAFGFAFVLIKGNLLFVPLALSIVLVVAVISLVRYLEKTTRDLTRILLTVREGIYMDETRGRGGASYSEEGLSTTLKEITREFGKLGMEKEIHYQYLKTLNETIAAGILAIREDGSMKMINPAAKIMLGVSHLRTVSGLKRNHPKLYDLLQAMLPGQSELAGILIRGEETKVTIDMRELVLHGEKLRIFVLQNINRELDRKEVEAWQQLTSVLTHEIMNSVTPLSSLATAAQVLLRHPDGRPKDVGELSTENLEDLNSSVETIASRSRNLLRFVNSYKAFTTKIPLRFEETEMCGLVSRLAMLLRPQAESSGLTLNCALPQKPVVILVDVSMTEHAIINVLKNALEAHRRQAQGTVTLELTEKGGRVVLSVSDNGPGISPEVLPKIFVPFFTTKTHGTGVGLALARQIMQSHGGTIHVSTVLGEGTTFRLEWPGRTV